MSLRIDEAQLFANLQKPETSNCEEGTENVDENHETTTHNNSNPPSPDPLANFDVEAQQKALQRLTSSLGLGTFRTPLNIPPFLAAALQQNPFSLQQQLLGLASGMSGVSPGPDDDDDENGANGEPEDLTLGLRKDTAIKTEETIENSLGGAGNPTWSYEEQFKQLYELSDDVKRKEWLDDWLTFMHRIGKPVTRIPIMAKQVLDLYELYRLVVQHGGLVEIINKKLWREITKGLNLPSSITSAAFTLRTQYQKYLYDYECEKEALSSPSDLQQAIDGNRREAPGRRNPSASAFPLGFPLPHPSASLLGKQLNGLGMRNDFLDDENVMNSLQPGNLFGGYRPEQLAMFEAHQRQFERAQRAAEAAARQSLGIVNCLPATSGRESTSSMDSELPAKRARIESENPAKAVQGNGIKISTKKADGSPDNSMVVSMEINGITYQGVLFALENKQEEVASTS